MERMFGDKRADELANLSVLIYSRDSQHKFVWDNLIYNKILH